MISCIIPIYNQADYLPACIKSIFTQTYKDFEVVAVDDCSTDRTFEILHKFKDQSENTFKIISNDENLKLPKTLNVGLDNTEGDYITWISSDCGYHFEAFRVMKEALDNNPDIGLVSTQFNIIGQRQEEVKHEPRRYDWKDLKVGNFVGCCFLFRREVFENVGYYNPDFLTVEDWDYWTRVSLKYPLLKIPGIYALWLDHSQSMTNTIVKDNLFGFKQEARLREKYKNAIGSY